MARMLVWSAMDTIRLILCLICSTDSCSAPKVLPISPKWASTSRELVFKISTSFWACPTDLAISSLTAANCSVASVTLEKFSPIFSSCSWNRLVSPRTLSKELPTKLNSWRDSTSLWTRSVWYSFKLSITYKTGYKSSPGPASFLSFRPYLCKTASPHPLLFKYHASHGLIDKLVIKVFPISNKPRMVPQRTHLPQILLHISVLIEQFIPKKAVNGKNG